jgi:hypothetical protein
MTKYSKYAVKTEMYCIGALCRGTKKFMSTYGARLCSRCKSHNNNIYDPEAEFGNAQGSRPKK